MRIIAITQARSGSTRLPEKIFLEIGRQSLLDIHVERIKRSALTDRFIIATTNREEDLRVCLAAERLNVPSFRGSEDDVLDRFYNACKNEDANYIVRVTSDCPLIDPDVVDSVIDATIAARADYGSNVLEETFPDGQDVEVFTFDALEKAWREATLRSDREHVTPYIRRNCDLNGGAMFKGINVKADSDYSDIRMTVDEAADFEVIKDLISKLGTDKGWKEYASYIRSNQSIAQRNAHITRNEGYIKSVKNDNNE